MKIENFTDELTPLDVSVPPRRIDISEERRLAAIMFTDMVGYSAIAQRDDKLALQLLEEHRDLLREIFPRFNGTEVKTMGDAFLVEFNSALEAAQCAIEIQRALARRNADTPPDRHIAIKIGIHIGDVIHRGGDVYGDGVNIASRIEPLAEAGGVCVSIDVERQIRNGLDTRFEKLGRTALKNISVPMELFRIVMPWEKEAASHGKSKIRSAKSGIPARSSIWMAIAAGLLLLIGIGWWWTIRKPAPLHDQPARQVEDQPINIPAKSIAVLPFENLSDDKANAYFAEGIQDEILTRLSKIAALKVISRTSTQKYKSAPDNLRKVGQQLGVANLLEGTVQKSGDVVHINVQLIKTATDEHVWAESYDRQLQNIFGVEGEVASAIADQLQAKLSGSEQEALTIKPTQNLAAYDAYLRGLAIEHNQYNYGAYQQAVREYAEAVQLDPNFAFAWARLSILRGYLYFNGVDVNINTPVAAKEAADRAMSLAPNAGESWIAQGAYRYRVLRDFAGAVNAYKQAEARLPNNAYVLENLAFVQRRLGRWQEAEANFKAALEVDPRDVTLLTTFGGEFYLFLRRFDDALAVLDRALEISPEATTHATKATVLQNEGRLEEAGKELASIPADLTDDIVVQSRIAQAIYERHFDTAISVIERKLRSIPAGQPLDAVTKYALVELGYCQQWTGHQDEARRSFARVVEAIKPRADSPVLPDSNGTPDLLALAYGGLGEKDKALEQVQRGVEQYADDAINEPPTLANLAQLQARFGDHEAAIAALSHLLEVPAGLTTANLRLDPLWDPLRKDPRFQKLSQAPHK